MACLKKHEVLLGDLAARLELPEEAVSGAAKVTVFAGKRALIENHRGVLEFVPERVVVATAGGKLILSGSRLSIQCMGGRDLLVCGYLQHAEWE